VAGPTLDDYYPNFVGVFGPDEAYRCIRFSNAHPISDHRGSAALADFDPDAGFEFGTAAPPPVCHDYLTDSFAPVDLADADYDGCDGVALPALSDPSDFNTPRASCVIRIDVVGAKGTDWTATLTMTMSASCTDPAVPPCDELTGTVPSVDAPVVVGWRQEIPIAACLSSGSGQPGCADPDTTDDSQTGSQTGADSLALPSEASRPAIAAATR
jgi:hypothetical protein